MARLLICIQAVDLDDPLMGFFVTWLEEAGKRFSQITVLALRVGRYTLPENITVIPLRPTGSHSKITVIKTLLRESWIRRRAYDAVFVRGDPYYVILAAWLWRLMGKKIIFWYAHWKVSTWAEIGSYLAHKTTSSVGAAFRHPTITPLFIGQNVDDTRFSAPVSPSEKPLRCLTFGSIRPNKKIENALQAFIMVYGGREETLTIIGPETDAPYLAHLRGLAEGHPTISFQDAVSYDRVPEMLRAYDVMVNACTGSLDKVIIEGMMSGLIVIASTPGVKEWLPEPLHWLNAVSLEEITAALRRVAEMTPEARWRLGRELRELAITHHSLKGQIQTLASLV